MRKLKYFAEIVISAGGSYLNRLPIKAHTKCFVITCKEDEAFISGFARQFEQIMDIEILLTGLLQQKLDFENHKVEFSR